MAKSNKQIEAEVLAFLDTIGESAEGFREAKNLRGLEKLIGLAVGNFIQRVQENLIKANKVDTGALSRDITQGDLITTGNGYEIEVGYPAGSEAAKYYDFVNKGVKGVRSGQPADTPYSFKNDKPGMNMQLAIAKWYRRNASFGRKETQKENLSGLQKKRKKLLKIADEATRLRSLAYATSVNIKRRGLKKTGFFDKAVEASFGKDFSRLVAVVSGREIAVTIRKSVNQ
jgi:hypothetical protein